MPEEFGPSRSGGVKKKQQKKRMLWFAAAFVVFASISLPKAPAEAVPAETKPVETQPVQIQQAPTEPTAVPTQAPEKETLPPVETYPLGSGIIEITVFNESVDPENDWSNKILYQGSFQEADFTELQLPEPEPQEGYRFMCFVLCSGKDSDGQLHYYRIGDTVTVADAALVAPDGDGVRHVEIHAAWQSAQEGDPWMLLTLDGNGGEPTEQYDPTGPMVSGGTIYLCAFPEPQRSGYQFAGWYWDAECTGEPVEWLQATTFFETDPEGWIDWRAKRPITLYARWIPE